MTLEQILKQIDGAEKTANIDIESPVYARTRSGIEVAVKQAKEELGKLRGQYEAAVLAQGVAIFLYGPSDKTSEFASVIRDLGEAAVIDAAAFYTKIADIVEPTLGASRTFTAEQAATMHKALNDSAREIGAHLTRPINISRQHVCATFAELVDMVRDIIRENLGDDLNAQALKRSLGQEGLKIRYMGSTSPVIVLNATQDEAVGLGQIFGKGRGKVELSSEDTIDKEFINQAFKNVQKQIKTKK